MDQSQDSPAAATYGIAAVAGLIARAMTAGAHVSVHLQEDAEQADLALLEAV